MVTSPRFLSSLWGRCTCTSRNSLCFPDRWRINKETISGELPSEIGKVTARKQATYRTLFSIFYLPLTPCLLRTNSYQFDTSGQCIYTLKKVFPQNSLYKSAQTSSQGLNICKMSTAVKLFRISLYLTTEPFIDLLNVLICAKSSCKHFCKSVDVIMIQQRSSLNGRSIITHKNSKFQSFF